MQIPERCRKFPTPFRTSAADLSGISDTFPGHAAVLSEIFDTFRTHAAVLSEISDTSRTHAAVLSEISDTVRTHAADLSEISDSLPACNLPEFYLSVISRNHKTPRNHPTCLPPTHRNMLKTNS